MLNFCYGAYEGGKIPLPPCLERAKFQNLKAGAPVSSGKALRGGGAQKQTRQAAAKSSCAARQGPPDACRVFHRTLAEVVVAAVGIIRP